MLFYFFLYNTGKIGEFSKNQKKLTRNTICKSLEQQCNISYRKYNTILSVDIKKDEKGKTRNAFPLGNEKGLQNSIFILYAAEQHLGSAIF